MNISRRHLVRSAVLASAYVAIGATASIAETRSRKGSLSGRKGYTVSGSVEVIKSGGASKVVLGENYVFDPSRNPPDIKIGFGNGERYARGSKIHNALTVKRGAATFDVPVEIDTDHYDELYIYCERFSVILAVAPLT